MGVQCWQARAAPRRRCCQQHRLGGHSLHARGGEEASLSPSSVFGYDAEVFEASAEPLPPGSSDEAPTYGAFAGTPCAEQPQVIAEVERILREALNSKTRACVSLKGATGTGKTLVMAKLVHELCKPVVWLCHTKDLAKQTVQSLRKYMPEIDVELLTSPFKDFRPSTVVDGRYKKSWGVPDEEAAASREIAFQSMKKGKLTIIVASCAAVFPCRHPKWPGVLPEGHEAKRALLEGIDEAIADVESELESLEEKSEQHTSRWQACMQQLQMLQRDRAKLDKTGTCSELLSKYSAYIPDELLCTPMDLMVEHYGQDWLLILDESHATISHLKTPYKGWRSRLRELVSKGCRLQSTDGFGPLSLEEFFRRAPHAVLLASATPDYEKMEALNLEPQEVVMVQRPTHILDPEVSFSRCGKDNELSFYKGFFDAIHSERRDGNQVLLACFKCSEAEVLAEVINGGGVLRAMHVHGGMDGESRDVALKAFREGEIDVLVGANLFREGLDFPRVGLIYIFDADRTGFMRNTRSLLQFVGRVARHTNGRAVLVHRKERPSQPMEECKEITEHNRRVQLRYNEHHGYTPKRLTTSTLPPLDRREELRPVRREEAAAEAKLAEALECGFGQQARRRLEAALLAADAAGIGDVEQRRLAARRLEEQDRAEASLRVVDMIGQVRAGALVEHYGTPEQVIQAARQGGKCPVWGVGEKTWLRMQENCPAIRKDLESVAFRKLLCEARDSSDVVRERRREQMQAQEPTQASELREEEEAEEEFAELDEMRRCAHHAMLGLSR